MIFSNPYKNTSDADLVDRVRKGDKRAFKEILSRHQNGVYAFALALLNDPHEAEDISQEVFLRLYRTAGAYKARAKLNTYLFRITRNLCIDLLRKNGPQSMSDPPEPVWTRTPDDHLADLEIRKHIDTVIAGLPQNQRAAIHLRHVQGMNYKEISQALGVTVHAVESLLARARKTFRKRYKI